ncbi:hypothetical protein OIU77_024848 [Salix suchowensis]|uniref:Uncharacterized protein n=1 Tax=Salix suchowensis TaxID=1278906 RepID=A0ABQ9BUZ9_9ROSI|nr:hypothetical protein OIU77_024848 [Salix suchowensis]
MICNFKLEGNILPSEITVELLQRAMQKSESRKYIINGFHVMKKILLHLGTVNQVGLVLLLLLDSLPKHLPTLLPYKSGLKSLKESTLHVLSYYSSKGKVSEGIFN